LTDQPFAVAPRQALIHCREDAMNFRICGLLAIAAFAAAPSQSRAANLTTLVSFCALQPNCADGLIPDGALILDADGNLFGTTTDGGAAAGSGRGGEGTVFEIAKTATGYATTPTTLVSFCALPNCADGSFPFGGLLADAEGNLFGTTGGGGAHGVGTVFEIPKTATGYAAIPTTLAALIHDGIDWRLRIPGKTMILIAIRLPN
jgi:uncharacterized repeat protein (TIGR03803 family)